MTLGPYTKEEAARACGCASEELCPGPMAAIDRGQDQDHLRWLKGGRQCPHPGTHQGEDDGPHGPGWGTGPPLAAPGK